MMQGSPGRVVMDKNWGRAVELTASRRAETISIKVATIDSLQSTYVNLQGVSRQRRGVSSLVDERLVWFNVG
jgi:hypothetical protein